MTIKELAAHLKLSHPKIYEMARGRSVPCSKLAGRRFSRTEIDAWARRRRPLPEKPEDI